MPEELQQSTIDQIDEFLKEEYDISLDNPSYTVYIIGSYATGDETPESDIDILFTEYESDWIEEESLKMFENAITINGSEVDLHINVTSGGVNGPAVKIS